MNHQILVIGKNTRSIPLALEFFVLVQRFVIGLVWYESISYPFLLSLKGKSEGAYNWVLVSKCKKNSNIQELPKYNTCRWNYCNDSAFLSNVLISCHTCDFSPPTIKIKVDNDLQWYGELMSCQYINYHNGKWSNQRRSHDLVIKCIKYRDMLMK